MASTEPVLGIRFGRTVVAAVVGDLLAQETDGVVVAANRRGVLGAPAVGIVRAVSGSDIEREAMARAPLDLGSAIVTGAPGLEVRGVRAIVHAVVRPALGEAAQLDDIRRATGAALLAADENRLRSLACPLLGVEAGLGRAADPATVATAMVDELVGCVRRQAVRLDRVVFTCRFPDHAEAATAAIARARERAWVLVR